MSPTRGRFWWDLLRKQVAVAPEESAADEVDHGPLVVFATRVAAVALQTGASSSEATEMLLRLGFAQGVRLNVDIIYTAVTVTAPETDAHPPRVGRRTVPALGWDYARLAHLEDVVDRFCAGELTLAEATGEVRRRGTTGPVYRRWVVAGAAFAQGASICALLGGVPLEIILAGLATLGIDLAVAWLGRRNVTYFFCQVVAGAIPMAIAMGLMVLRNHGVHELWSLSPSLVVASGMVSMLAGLGIVGAAQDALDGAYLTATARAVDVAMRTGGLILGVVGMLWLGVRLGLPAYLAPDPLPAPHPLVQVVSAAAFSLVFAVGAKLGPRGALLAGGLGGLLWTGYLLALPITGGDHAVAAGLASLGIAFAARLLARWGRLPAIALTTLGIAPLMPGMILYRGLYRLTVGMPAVQPGDDAGALFLLAALTGVFLALGSSIGGMLGRQVVLPRERAARLAAVLSRRRSQWRQA